MKNLIKNKSTKKATKNNNNFITPSYITRAGSLLNGVVDGGMAKQGFYDTESSIPNFYTPELTPDTWLLPRSRAEILRWPLLEGEKVWCNGKFVNIEDIKIGDKVLASNGKEQTVLNTMSKEADDVGVEIITRFAPPVQFGGNHPIWAVDTNKSTEYVSKCFRTCLYNNAISFDTVAKWYDAKDVKPGFMVKIPKYKIEKDIQIDLADYLPEETLRGYKFIVFENTINYKLGQTDQNIKRFLPLNKDVFEFLGWYVAEGHIHNNTIILTLANDELSIANYLKEVIVHNFDILEDCIHIIPHNGSYRLCINNPVLASFILNNFNTGSKDKVIPQWLLEHKKEHVISFLRGWIKGDGKITDEALEDQTSGFSLTTTSEQLSKMGYMLFNKVGCIVGVKEVHQTLAEAQKKAGFKYTIQSCAPVVYYLTANGNRVKNIFPELTYTEKVCPNFYEDEDYYYTTVKSVKIFETTKRFHCVTTEDHTICVPYITHNCRLFFNLDPYINSILTMHAQYPICNFRLSYKDKDTEEFFNRKLFFNKEFSWIDFLEQLMLSYLKLGEACLTGDTNIRLLDGTTKTLKELYDSKARDFWVYSVDDKGNIIGSKADEVVLTRKNAELVKVTLDNGESFRCTPDHKIMLRDGSYKEAKDLLPNDALMPLYYKDSYVYYNKNHSKHKYEIVYNPGDMTLDQNSGHWKFTHRVISLQVNGVSKGKIIHHKNFNNRDNRPENLEVLSYSEHRIIHAKEYTDEEIENFRQKSKDNYNKPGYREKMSKAISQGMTPKVRKVLSEKSKAFWCKDENREMARKNSVGRKHTPETIAKLKALAKERYLKNPEDVMNRLKKATAVASEANKGRKHTDEYKQKMSQMMKEKWEKGIYKNHKVLKVESCGYEDVYDIHSSGKFHNFAIETGKGSGVFVHNCVWGDFSEANGTWTNFTLIDPALINYKEDPMSGEVEMSIIPTRELKEMIADALKQGRQDVPIEYIKCVQENHEIPLDASEVEANYLTGRKYSPARVFMMARRTDPASTRGVPMIQSCFKTLIYSDKIKLAQIACASGDTKVRLLDGQVKTMEELYKSNEKDFWVYSCTEKGEIVYKKASKVICNGKKQLYKIKLDNGDYLRFTADHPFLMRDGSWKEVKDLRPGDSLMPLYLRERKIGSSMYDQVYSPIEDKWEFVHRLIPLTGKFKGCVIHHKNFKGKDNRPENLVPMSVEEHSHMHRDLTIKRQPELQKAVQKYRETEQYKKDLIRNGKIISKVRTEQEREKYKKGVRYKLLTSLPECGYKVIDYLDKNQTAKKNFERVANAFGLDIKVRSFFGKLLIYKTSVINNSDFKRVLRDLSYDLQHRTAVKDQISTEYKDFLSKYTLLKNKEVDYLIIPISNYSSIHSLRSTISRYIKQDGFSSLIKTSELRGYNCIIVYNSYAQEIINRTKTESRVFANNQKKGIVDIWNHKVVSVEKDAIENVYDIESVDDTHTFGVVTSDGSGVFVHNCADRLHLPIEIWSVGQYTGDPNTSIIPDDTMLANVREAIREATMQPPFSIFVPPYIKYEAVGVNGKLLSVYEDLGYVENCIFVALGVNKNLILGQGPSFSSSKQTSLFKLIKMYKMMRLKLEAFIKRYIILPIAKANDIKDEYGEYVVPEIEWEESLQPEQDVEMFNNVLKLWDKGLVSTMTLYEYFPGQLDINLEKKRMEEEKRSVFDKGTDRLGAKSLREDLKEDSPESKSTPKPSDGKGPAKDMPSPISGGEALEGLEKGEEETPPAGGSEPTPSTPPEGLEGE